MIYIGAEIFIERGQTAEEIYSWFETMHQHGMRLTRIRMFETYMRLPNGDWDFSLFDTAFLAAEKYGIRIYANLFPATDFDDVGGFKFPKSDQHLEEIRTYIAALVQHFSQFNSLYGWVPINEPGVGKLPEDPFTVDKFKQWQSHKSKSDYDSNGFTILPFDQEQFLLDYNTWFLEWLCTEIRQYDPLSPIHVNNHDIFRNVAEYDFPSWRAFLSSLGGSAHASWHFEYFNRSQYAVAMSANAEIIRSGAGNLPWFMTELQGGNNTYSGKQPMCPTPEEIAQWIWINIGAGSKGAMFWCLNPRRSGFEAGEWAMLDYLNQPTDRLLIASSIANVINAQGDLFNDVEVYDSGISVLYTRESLWIEKALQIEGTHLEGRSVGGVMKSALSYFEALSEMGVHAAFEEIGEYDFDKADFTGKVIILSHQISIPSKYWETLNQFVFKGGKIIMDGLSAYYDENACLIQGAYFPLQAAMGAVMKEYKMIGQIFELQLSSYPFAIPAHLWRGQLKVDGAKPLSNSDDEVFACKTKYGNGSTFWCPSLLGLGGRLTNYYTLSQLLLHECSVPISACPVRLIKQYSGFLMKILLTINGLITIIVNKSAYRQSVALDAPDYEIVKLLFSVLLREVPKKASVTLEPEETLVLYWESKK